MRGGTWPETLEQAFGYSIPLADLWRATEPPVPLSRCRGGQSINAASEAVLAFAAPISARTRRARSWGFLFPCDSCPYPSAIGVDEFVVVGNNGDLKIKLVPLL
jgi:hypothetical protein